MLSPDDLTALWVTLKLAAVSTVLLIVLATPLAWWLSQTRARGRVLV
jgi:molybdate transport system permease protein